VFDKGSTVILIWSKMSGGYRVAPPGLPVLGPNDGDLECERYAACELEGSSKTPLNLSSKEPAVTASVFDFNSSISLLNFSFSSSRYFFEKRSVCKSSLSRSYLDMPLYCCGGLLDRERLGLLDRRLGLLDRRLGLLDRRPCRRIGLLDRRLGLLDRRLGLLDRRLGLLDRRLFLSVSLRSGAAVFGQFFVTCPVSGQFRHFPNLLPSSIFSGDLDFLCFGLLERSGFSSEDLDLFLVFAGSGSPVGSSGVTNFL